MQEVCISYGKNQPMLIVGRILSLRDSKDAIEQLYGDEILKCFPNYEAFWLEFIGNPKAKQVGAYEYMFPSSMAPSERNEILRGYERIQMVHYSLFCHFAGAHFQLKELENTENIKNAVERYFRQLEHYETAYVHLGSAFYMLKSLWKKVLKLQRYPTKFRELEKFLTLKGEKELAKRMDEVEDTVKIRRDQAVHYGRMSTLPCKGKFYVPLEPHRDMKWSEAQEIEEWMDSIVSLRQDLTKTENVINALHQILISEYEEFISQKNIQIDYGEHK